MRRARVACPRRWTETRRRNRPVVDGDENHTVRGVLVGSARDRQRYGRGNRIFYGLYDKSALDRSAFQRGGVNGVWRPQLVVISNRAGVDIAEPAAGEQPHKLRIYEAVLPTERAVALNSV